METKRENAWLSKQIEAAKNNRESWPNWMQKAARFEGNVNNKSTDETQRCCRVVIQLKK